MNDKGHTTPETFDYFLALRRAWYYYHAHTHFYGPRLARTDIFNFFVQNEAFYIDLAKDIGEYAPFVIKELRRTKITRPDLFGASEEIMSVLAELRRRSPHLFQVLQLRLQGLTFREITKSNHRVLFSVKEDFDKAMSILLTKAGAPLELFV